MYDWAMISTDHKQADNKHHLGDFYGVIPAFYV